ncbi:dihydrolipoyl dehydrogenase [Buchnera aphidicola]|uniref:dihydrolipoyl dehydrogenase n=1 Tax=Buchnera aphidicola TaxID=9 RepID=UPI0030ECEE3E
MHKNLKTNLVVIGGGPAGYSAAFRASDLGLKTIIIEKNNFLGGVCLHKGCIPSKALLHIAKVLREFRDFSKLGIFKEKKFIDIKKIVLWKNNLIEKMSLGLKSLSDIRGIKVIIGNASFFDKNTLYVVSPDKKVFYIKFDSSIIATGSRPNQFPLVSKKNNNIWNSTDALKLSKIPKKLLIVGGGVIGLEMATIYQSFGSKVDIIENSSRLLPSVDSDISKLYFSFIKNKFNIYLSSFIKNIQVIKKGIKVLIKDDFKCIKKVYDTVLLSIGRRPNIEGLNLEKIGINFKNGFIKVDKQCKTNVSNIYAIGDVSGPPMLAHKGSYEAHIAAEVISGKNHYFDTSIIPMVAYTDPEIAWVGMTEKMAIKNNINYETASFPWSASGRALVTHSSSGITKLIFDKNTNKIIGGLIIGSNAGELLGEISLAIEMGCHVADISLTIHAHPTLYESISASSKIFERTITDLINKK